MIDDRAAPAEIPVTADTECFGFVVLTAMNALQGAYLTILDGGRLRNVGAITNGIILLAAPTSVRPLYFGGIASFQGMLLSDSVIGNTTGATVAMIEADCSMFEINSQLVSGLDNTAEPTVPIVHINPGNFFGWNVQQNVDSLMSPNLIEGDGTTTLNIDNDGSIEVVAQSLFLGSFLNNRLDKAAALQPSSGATRPANPLSGQMHFDTSLVPMRAIWWDGIANWVDGAGSVV